LELGLDHYEAVAGIYFIQAGIAILAYYMRYESDVVIIGVYVAFCAIVVSLLLLARKAQFSLRPIVPRVSEHQEHFEIRARIVKSLKSRIRDIALSLVTGLIFSYLSFRAIYSEKVSFDISLICFIVAIFLIVYYFKFKGHGLTWFERASLYLICTYIVYLTHLENLDTHLNDHYYLLYFAVLALFIFTALYCTSHSQFEITTHDFIVIFVAFIIPSLPESFLSESRIGEMVTKLIVMYYGIELILTFVNKSTNKLRILVIGIFCLLGLQSFI
jgi:UDP-GlcNAc:undecaprenyl-phosphate GlcNAc-1-phosphate transferase